MPLLKLVTHQIRFHSLRPVRAWISLKSVKCIGTRIIRKLKTDTKNLLKVFLYLLKNVFTDQHKSVTILFDR